MLYTQTVERETFELLSKIMNDSLRLYGAKDIAAMKIAAIADNGSRLKDFVDIAYLSTKISLKDMIDAYLMKFPETSSVSPLKAIVYYDDIIFDEPINIINGSYRWESVRKRINDMLKFPDKVFETFPL